MILPAELHHKEQVTALWCSAFGDKKEDVKRYLDEIFKYFFVYEEDGVVKGMLTVLPVSFCGKKGGYVYAVATHINHRGNGICNKLMEHIKGNSEYEFLVLKPQNEGLFEFYGKMGFERVNCTSNCMIVAEKEENRYNLKSLSAQEYELARSMYLDGKIIEWDKNMLSFAKDMYSGSYYAVEKDENLIGLAFLYKNKNVAVIKELLAEDKETVANFIVNELLCKEAKVTYYDENGNDGYMIYSKDIKKVYFNIYFD